MLTFPDQPDLEPVSDRLYRLRSTYLYLNNDGFFLRIKKGYTSDGASVPRLVWTLTGITPDGLHRAAALIHDYIYDHAGRLPPQSCSKLSWTRKEADQIFLRIMREAGVSSFKSAIAYRAVRAFGWTGWK